MGEKKKKKKKKTPRNFLLLPPLNTDLYIFKYFSPLKKITKEAPCRVVFFCLCVLAIGKIVTGKQGH